MIYMRALSFLHDDNIVQTLWSYAQRRVEKRKLCDIYCPFRLLMATKHTYFRVSLSFDHFFVLFIYLLFTLAECTRGQSLKPIYLPALSAGNENWTIIYFFPERAVLLCLSPVGKRHKPKEGLLLRVDIIAPLLSWSQMILLCFCCFSGTRGAADVKRESNIISRFIFGMPSKIHKALTGGAARAIFWLALTEHPQRNIFMS